MNPNLLFLGATQDDITCEQSVTGIIEVKCPFSVKDISINDACETSHAPTMNQLIKKFSLFHVQHFKPFVPYY